MEKQLKVYFDDEDHDLEFASVESNESLEENRELVLFKRIKTQIERDLSDLSSVKEEISKMRENVARLELDLVSRVSSSTWENVSKLIGVSSNMMDCIKVPTDDDYVEHGKK